MGPEFGAFGAIALLFLVMAGLGFLLFLVPIPLWDAPTPCAARHGGHGADQRGEGRARHPPQ